MVPEQQLYNEISAFDVFTLAEHNSWKLIFDKYVHDMKRFHCYVNNPIAFITSVFRQQMWKCSKGKPITETKAGYFSNPKQF
jgi:hypothetical protein